MAYVSTDESNWLERYGLKNKSYGIGYLYSFYWVSNTMLLAGSGSIIPQITEELTVSLITQIIGLFLIINCIIRFFLILKNMEIDDKIKNKNIMMLSRFMNLTKINKDLQMRVRSFLRFKWENEQSLISNKIKNEIEFLSQSLQKELYFNAYGHLLKNHSVLFAIFSEEFLFEVSKKIEQKFYFEGDLIFERYSDKNKAYFFIESGKVELFYLNNIRNGSSRLEILSKNKNFGGYTFITDFNHIYSSRALENTKIFQISREDFIEIIKKFPQDHQKFCEFKDNLIFNNKHSTLDIKCPICNSNDHIIGSCNISQLTVNRKKAITKFLSSKTQIRNESHFQRKRKKLNSLKSKQKLFGSIEKSKLLSFNTENSYIFRSVEEEGGIFLMSENSEEDLSPKQRELKFRNSMEENESIKKHSMKESILEKIKSIQETNKKETKRNPGHFDVDGITNFEFYFPKQNVGFFIEKMQKLRRKKHTTLIEINNSENPLFNDKEELFNKQ